MVVKNDMVDGVFMKLHQIRNATIILEYAGKRFLIDPMFAPKEENILMSEIPWPLHNLPVPPKDIIKNIDAVVITHLHIDHFDKFAQEILPKGTKIFVQDLFDKHALEKEHFNNIKVVTDEGVDFEEVRLFKTDCMHGDREFAEHIFLANGMRYEAMGVVFKSYGEPVLYLAGDTIWYEGVKQAIDLHKPKYIVLNADCAKIGGDIPVTAGIEDIKALHGYYPEGKLIASHTDCVGNGTVTRADLRASEAKDYVYALADGEIMLLE